MLSQKRQHGGFQALAIGVFWHVTAVTQMPTATHHDQVNAMLALQFGAGNDVCIGHVKVANKLLGLHLTQGLHAVANQRGLFIG